MHKQLNRHDPANGVYGDCHRACIANLLGLPVAEVPHFCDGPPEEIDGPEFRRRIAAYLEPLGYTEATVAYADTFDNVLEAMRPNGFYILGGMSRNGCNHSVIAKGAEIYFDPSLDDSGIVGPMDDGYFRVSFIARQPS